jgi:hypothetical protein
MLFRRNPRVREVINYSPRTCHNFIIYTEGVKKYIRILKKEKNLYLDCNIQYILITKDVYKSRLTSAITGGAQSGYLQRLDQCCPTFSTSRYPWPRSLYLTLPLEGNVYFFKLIYFLIISYVRDKVVYFCWVSINALINNVILFIYFISTSRGTPRKCSRYPRVPRNPGWESLV